MKKIAVVTIALVLNTLSGCQSDYQIKQSISTTLSADATTKLIEDVISFRLMNVDGDDLTEEATFLVDGSPIEGHLYTSDLIGTHRVVAEYKGVASNELIVSFHDGSQVLFAKNVLIEDYTGTWCGYCPRVAYGIELVKQQTNNAVVVGIHRASNNPSDAFYDPYNFDSQALEDMIQVPGYPKGMLNRNELWRYPEPNKVAQVLGLTQGDNPRIGLAIDSERNGNNLSVTVDVKTSQNFNNVKLVVYVLENGLVHEQHNYTSYYNGEDVIAGFQHDHVLRACLTNLLGDAIPNEDVRQGYVYSRTFNLPMPTTVADPTKTEIVAFVVDADGRAINVRQAITGSDQDFQEL